ncbi:MAG: hypothetical protein CVV62_02150 [Tenericutes bacterium HGW-Tenericutes-7]|nr:MAG: hypothetical protein CVV62_02150 [Tenericutes bacterium HGW-Tenericutes-7]
MNATRHTIAELESYDKLYGRLSEIPHISGAMQFKGEYIIYDFSLSIETDIMFTNHENFTLYDSNHRLISIGLRSGYMVYRLLPGDYYVRVTFPDYYEDSFYPAEYVFMLNIFTEQAEDDSIYPYFDLIEFSNQFIETRSNYLNDTDGYRFILSEPTQIHLYTNSTVSLIKDNKLYNSSMYSGDYNLPAGTYDILCSSHQNIWTMVLSRN